SLCHAATPPSTSQDEWHFGKVSSFEPEAASSQSAFPGSPLNLNRSFSSSLTRLGPPHEWHLDLEKRSKMEKLGSYPICPDSRRERDLSAIRPPHRRAHCKHPKQLTGADTLCTCAGQL